MLQSKHRVLTFTITIALVIVGFYVAIVCVEHSVPSDALIVKTGTYTIPGGGHLQVLEEGRAISYVLTGPNDATLLRSVNAFNATQRWYMAFGQDGSLWVYSGDVGTSVWSISEDGGFMELPMTTELCKHSPSIFRLNLPSELRAIWNCPI